MNDTALLQSVYLFRSMTAGQLQQIAAAAHTETLAAGAEIFNQGEQADAFYLIKSGSVRIRKRTPSGETVDVTRLTAGAHFGEMSYVDHEARSASAAAAERTEVIVMPYKEMDGLLRADAALAARFYKGLAHFLCGRLRVTTNDLSFAREENLIHF